MAEAQQAALFHETVFDAIGCAIQALGGAKKVAGMLWPSMKPESAYTRLRHCLGDEFPEKLDMAEVLLIAARAKQVGDHLIMQYLATDLGYELKALQPAEAKRQARNAREIALLEELLRLKREQT